MLYRVCYYYYSDARGDMVCRVIQKGMTIEQAKEFKFKCIKKILSAKGSKFEYPADLKVIIQYDSLHDRIKQRDGIIDYMICRYTKQHALKEVKGS